MEQCVFCRIIARQIPASIVAETDEWIAFRDIHPMAPTHVLIVPKRHIVSVADLTDGDAGLAGSLFLAAKRIAESEGVAATGYRIIANTGPDAGQAVGHLHLHLLGGRHMGPKLG